MVSLNKIMIVGNLVGNPEMRATTGSQQSTLFDVGTDSRYVTAEGERKQETESFTIVARGRLAEQCNRSLSKGKLVYVEGRLRSRSWHGVDGQKHFRNEIIASSVSFLDGQAPDPVSASDPIISNWKNAGLTKMVSSKN